MVKGGCTGAEMDEYMGQLPIPPENYGMILNRRDHDKYTALHCAIFARNFQAAQALLKHGADPNLKCHGTPSLHLALASAILPENKEMGLAFFKLFLDNDADTLAKDDQLAGILHLAAEYSMDDILEMLLAPASEEDKTAENFDREFAYDVEINAKDRAGLRPLHRAAMRDNASSAKILISKGSFVNAQTSYGSTALHLCAAAGSSGAWAAIQTSQGIKTENAASGSCNPSIRDKWGRTASDQAAVGGWDGTGKLRGGSYRAKGYVLYTIGVLCIRHLWCSSIITCNTTSYN